MEQRFKQLVSRLVLLGYNPYERKNIIKESIGTFSFAELSCLQRTRAIKNLEKYEQMGATFLRQYSK